MRAVPGAPAAGIYAFGDNPVAGRRLDVLGAVFRPTTETLLRGLPATEPRTVLDLGCGPGHTTRLLAERFPAATVLGLDESPAFVRLASHRPAPPNVQFTRHDVTRTPLPSAPADVIYARYLLAHLPEPAALITAWASQLAPGGLLVLEEAEWIRTEDPDFTRYLALTAGLLSARGTELYVGTLLGRLPAPPGTTVAHRAVAVLDPPAGDAATMFSLNLATVRQDELIQARHPAPELDALSAALTGRIDDPRPGAITWGIRQLVLRRADHEPSSPAHRSR